MRLSDETMAKLAERHAAEKALLRDVTRRYERAAAAADQAREALGAAEAERAAVLVEWAAAPGWDAERVGEAVHVAARAVTELMRAATHRANSAPPAAADLPAPSAVPPVPPARGAAVGAAHRGGFGSVVRGDDVRSSVA